MSVAVEVSAASRLPVQARHNSCQGKPHKAEHNQDCKKPAFLQMPVHRSHRDLETRQVRAVLC